MAELQATENIMLPSSGCNAINTTTATTHQPHRSGSIVNRGVPSAPGNVWFYLINWRFDQYLKNDYLNRFCMGFLKNINHNLPICEPQLQIKSIQLYKT